MKTRRLAPALRLAGGVCLLAVLSACSLLHRHHAKADAPDQANAARAGHRPTARGLALEVKASPDPVKLGEVREIAVTFTVRNVSQKAVTLKFNTEQVFEIDLRDVATGAVVSKWSTDRTFTQDNHLVPINKGERLEYNQTITTRDLKPGRAYNLEAYYVGYENELLAKKVLIPQP